MIKKAIVPAAIFTILALVAWTFLGSGQEPEEQTVEEASNPIELPSVDTNPQEQETNPQEPTATVSEDDQRAYDLRDPSTWGEPTGWDSDGNPTGFRRVMPNGNVRTVTPFHGELNTSAHPVHADSLPITAQYKHWHNGSAVDPLPVISCVDSQWESAVSKYIAVWNQSPFIHMSAQPFSGLGSGGLDCFDEYPGMIAITNFDFGVEWGADDNVYAGFAFGDHNSDGHMLSASIALNDGKDWFSPQFSTPEEIDAWRDVTVCHEIGHALGLGHNDENKETVTGTCMDYARTPFPNLNPDAHDFEHIAVAYDHTHERMGVSCKLGDLRGPLAGSPIFYGVVAADNFFKTPYAPERKTAGEWVVVSRWNGLESEFGYYVTIAQSKSSPLFNQQEYFFTDQTIEYGFGAIDPGPNHTYFEAFSSEQEVQTVLAQEIEQNLAIGLLEECTDWKVHLPDLLWDTSLEYHPLNSPALGELQNQIREDSRGE